MTLPPVADVDESRRVAIAALPPEAVAEHLDALLKLLGDHNWRVRREAALAIARAPDAGVAVSPLLDAVCGHDVIARNAALEALRAMGSAAVSPCLARLPTEHGPARRFVVEALLEAADVQCVAPMRALLHDADPNLPPAAAEVLGVIPGALSLDALAEAVTHADPVVRLAALTAFEARGEVSSWASVSALVEDPICGAHAVRALAAVGDRPSLARVVAAVSASHRSVALAAITAAARFARHRDDRALQLRTLLLGDPLAIAALVARAERGTAVQRACAIEVLGLAGDSRTLDVVLRACDAPEPDVLAVAEAALDGFDTAEVPFAVERAQRMGAGALRAAMAWALRRGGAASPALAAVAWTTLASHAAAAAHAAAAELIAACGDDDDARAVARHLARSLAEGIEPSTIVAALERLLRTHRSDVEPMLAAMVSSSERGLRVAYGLARVGFRFDPAPLHIALDADQAHVRVLALRVLAAAPAGLDDAAVGRAMRDASPEVRGALAEAVRAGATSEHACRTLWCDADAGLRAAAFAALVARGRSTDDDAAAALADRSEDVALEALRSLGSRVTDAALVAATRHPRAAVAIEALACLAERGRDIAQHSAVAMLEHTELGVREAAVRTIDSRALLGRGALLAARDREHDAALRAQIELVLVTS